jgi:hypothetical protein
VAAAVADPPDNPSKPPSAEDESSRFRGGLSKTELPDSVSGTITVALHRGHASFFPALPG